MPRLRVVSTAFFAVLSMGSICQIRHAEAQGPTAFFSQEAVDSLSTQLSLFFKEAACTVLRTGGGCKEPGYETLLQDLELEGGYNRTVLHLEKDILEKQVLPKLQQIFQNASQVITKLRDNMERLIVTRHRIARLQVRDFSALPEWDPTHPRFAEATDKVLEGKQFNKPVIKASTIKYAPHTPRDGRKEMLAANASEGLDEFFVENLNNPNFNFLRWQRFVSHTGLIRQFPGAYDVEEYDNRLTDWYNMATQAPKRILFLLDLSTSMREMHRFEIAKQTVITLLGTLIPEDLTNVLLVDDRGSTPQCFGGELVPATKEHIAYLQNYVRVASVVPADQQLLNTVVKAVSVFEEADEKMSQWERDARASRTACKGMRCVPKLEYIMFVSDGWFTLDSQYSELLESLASSRPSLHINAIAVGDEVDEKNMLRISCAFNGLYFKIPPLGSEEERRAGADVIHESYILNRMSEYFQLVASPLARNHTALQREYSAEELKALSLDATWTMPRPDPERSSVLITIALPCFGDADSDTPRLLGVVAVDLLFLGPLLNNGVSVLSSFLSASSDDLPRTVVDTAVVFKDQYPGVTLIDSHLLLKYHRLSRTISNFDVFEPYEYDEHMGTVFQASGIMDQVLHEHEGNEKIEMEQKMYTLDVGDWRFEPVKAVKIDATVAWKHLDGHPFVLLLIIAGAPDSDGYTHFVDLNVANPDSQRCPNATAGTEGRCWNTPSRHISETRPNTAVPGSLLYLPAWAFKEVSLFVHQDALGLPPSCGQADTLPCNAMPRLRTLMRELNGELEVAEDDTNITGSGLTNRARNEILVTALIDELWDKSFAESDPRLLRRVYLSTAHGVFRTRAQPNMGAPTLPMLYDPVADSWYKQAIGDQDRIVLGAPVLSLMDADKHLEHVVVISQLVRHGFFELDDPDFSQATAAGVIAAELDYGLIHSRLYGEDGLVGRGNTTYVRCRDPKVQCYVVDQHGLVVLHPDFTEGSSGLNWKEERLSLGDVEPLLMESMVTNGIMQQNVRRHTSLTDKKYSWLLTYTVQLDKLPFEQTLFGETTGHYFVSHIKETTSVLIVIADYRSESIYHFGCGVLSSQCENSEYPQVSEVSLDPCVGQSSPFLYRRAYAATLIPSFDHGDVVHALRLMHFCKAVKPSWIWHVSIGGGCFVVFIFASLIAKQILYHRRRAAWIQARQQEDVNSYSSMNIHKQQHSQPTAEESELKQVQRRVEQLFDESHAMLKMPNTTIDDIRKMIEQQATLTTTLRDRKSLSQDVEKHNLETLAVDLSTMRLLASNLKDRLTAHETERAQSSLQFINTDMQKLDRQVAELQKKLEDYLLPSVSIPSDVHMPMGAMGSVDGVAQAVDPEEEMLHERNFYEHYYPHLFHYDGKHALESADATGQLSTQVRTLDDVTEPTAPSNTVLMSSAMGPIPPFKP